MSSQKTMNKRGDNNNNESNKVGRNTLRVRGGLGYEKQGKREHARERATEILLGGERRQNARKDIERIAERGKVQDRIFATVANQSEYAKIIKDARLYEDKTYKISHNGVELSGKKIDEDALTSQMKEMRIF